MAWSFKIAEVSGITIKVHITFFLILLLGAFQWGTPYGAEGALFGVVLMILLFVCVTLHELGHSVVAQRFGVSVREIVLLPLGGVAVMGRNDVKPLHELLITVTGPLVNVVLSVILAAIIFGLGGMNPAGLTAPGTSGQRDALSLTSLLTWLLQANITLVLFNLIPAFPLDGGRMLRALLAMRLGAQRATFIASRIGQFFAVVLGVVGVATGQVVLVLVAAFVFFGAGQENTEGQARSVLTRMQVGKAYNSHALTVTIGDHVSKIVDYLLTSYQPDFAVVQGTRLLGIITREDVLRALAEGKGETFVTEIMRREVVRVADDMTLEQVRVKMMETSVRVVAVFNGELFLGLVSIEDIAEAFTIISLSRQPNQGQTAPDA